MVTSKRLIVCTLGGVIASLICISAGSLTGNVASFWPTAFIIFLNRTLLGFVIGISTLRLPYLLHGLLLGLLVSLLSAEFEIPKALLMFITAGMIYGMLIEFFASKVFHSPKR